MKKTADVVVIGGGNAGTSAAYHLAKAGVKNVVLVEQQYTPFGGSGRCAAMFRAQFATDALLRVARLSIDEFDVLGEMTGYGDLEISKGGYLLPFYTEEQKKQAEANVALQKQYGFDSYVLDPKGCKEVSPYLDVNDGMLGGTWNTDEGVINPMKIALSYKYAAQKMGVEFYNYTKVTGIRVENGEIQAVETDKGDIETHCVVNAAGEWGKFIGRMAGVSIPLEPEKHQIVVTEPLEYIKAPMIYSLNKWHTYIVQVKHGGFLCGWSDPDVEAGVIDFKPEWKVLEEIARRCTIQVPALKDVRIIRHWAGQYGNLPDHSIVVGEAPEVKGFFNALGATKATMFAPGLGILAAGAVVGDTSMVPDMQPYTLDRFEKGILIHDPALL